MSGLSGKGTGTGRQAAQQHKHMQRSPYGLGLRDHGLRIIGSNIGFNIGNIGFQNSYISPSFSKNERCRELLHLRHTRAQPRDQQA